MMSLARIPLRLWGDPDVQVPLSIRITLRLWTFVCLREDSSCLARIDGCDRVRPVAASGVHRRK
jgi:hypothetical protein